MNIIKPHLRALLIAVLAVSYPSFVFAGSVTIEWEAVITEIQPSQIAATGLPDTLEEGQTFSGSFTYDSSDPGEFFTDETTRYNFPTSSYTINLPGLPTFNSTAIGASVTNNNVFLDLDEISFFANALQPDDLGFTIAFRDFDATTFSDQSLPDVVTPSFLGDQEFQQLTISRRSGDTIFANPVTGQFISFESTIAVPEPSSFALMLMASVGIASFARRWSHVTRLRR